jgi:hypothetical protein
MEELRKLKTKAHGSNEIWQVGHFAVTKPLKNSAY